MSSKILLHIPCPIPKDNMPCETNYPVYWVCKQDNSRIWICINGDLECERGHKGKIDFIQNWKFNCGKHVEYYYASHANINFALALAVASSTDATQANYLINLTNSINNRWRRN